jgi:hypothetical protein
MGEWKEDTRRLYTMKMNNSEYLKALVEACLG